MIALMASPSARPLVRSIGLAPVLILLAGCGRFGSPPADEKPTLEPGQTVEVVTAAPDAGGALSFRNCPTLDEARAAVPLVVSGPDANAVPYKTMVLQCSYAMNERDVQGRPAGIGILVFDTSAEGDRWDSVRTDPGFPNPTDVPGLAEVAFATGEPGHYDLWVVQGGYSFHMSHTRPGGIELAQMVALGRAMLTGLGRPPR